MPVCVRSIVCGRPGLFAALFSVFGPETTDKFLCNENTGFKTIRPNLYSYEKLYVFFLKGLVRRACVRTNSLTEGARLQRNAAQCSLLHREPRRALATLVSQKHAHRAASGALWTIPWPPPKHAWVHTVLGGPEQLQGHA